MTTPALADPVPFPVLLHAKHYQADYVGRYTTPTPVCSRRVVALKPRRSSAILRSSSFTLLSISFILFKLLPIALPTMAAPQQDLTFNDVFEDEDVDEPKAANTVHHIRANSSIMQLKKILGGCLRPLVLSCRAHSPKGLAMVK